MRTARSVLVLDNRRPRSASAMQAVAQSFDRLADGAQRIGPIRFAGYTSAAEAGVARHVRKDARVAVYEADYPDDAA